MQAFHLRSLLVSIELFASSYACGTTTGITSYNQSFETSFGGPGGNICTFIIISLESSQSTCYMIEHFSLSLTAEIL